MRDIRRAIKAIAKAEKDGVAFVPPEPVTPSLRAYKPRKMRTVRTVTVPAIGAEAWFSANVSLVRNMRGDATLYAMGRLAGVSPVHVRRAEEGVPVPMKSMVKLLKLYCELLTGGIPTPPPRREPYSRKLRHLALQVFAVRELEYSPSYEVPFRQAHAAYCKFHADFCALQQEADGRIERNVSPFSRRKFKHFLRLPYVQKRLLGAKLRGVRDPVGEFVHRCCVREPLAMVRVSKFMQALGETGLHPRAVGLQLSRMGVWRDATRKYYVGVRLR
jgi:hypothetical protein